MQILQNVVPFPKKCVGSDKSKSVFLIELFEIRKIKQNFLVCFTITFAIEIVQYIFKVGMLDVDDILLCVAGMMSFYYFYGKYRGKKQKTGDVDESRTKMEEWTGKITEKS